MRRSTKPDPEQFPTPHIWASWVYDRDPQFKTHSTLGQVKNAIGTRARAVRGASAVFKFDCYAYRWDEDLGGWVETDYIGAGMKKEDAHLFRRVVPRSKAPIKGPSDKAVQAAIDSIKTEEV